jgi:DNA modification methylase
MNAQILVGDVRTRLAEIPDASIQTCITSPPYWGLRDYGQDDQIGLEQSPQDYVDAMVEVFKEVKRVLRDDGTLWLNVGDSYAGSGKRPAGNLGKKNDERNMEKKHSAIIPNGLKAKDLVGIPWRLAFALQADGWYLRQDIIWAKPNPMPESVSDRCTKSHEYIFLMTKSAKYYYDHIAIKEPSVTYNPASKKKSEKKNIVGNMSERGVTRTTEGLNLKTQAEKTYEMRNRRDVWIINTKAFKGAHFAVMPEKLVEPSVLAGTSEFGCCSKCGTSYVRIIKKGEIEPRKTRDYLLSVIPGRDKPSRMQSVDMLAIPVETVGWQQSCNCIDSNPIPSTVLDPFTGSGTVAVVALRNNRNFIGTELNPEYAQIAIERIGLGAEIK